MADLDSFDESPDGRRARPSCTSPSTGRSSSSGAASSASAWWSRFVFARVDHGHVPADVHGRDGRADVERRPPRRSSFSGSRGDATRRPSFSRARSSLMASREIAERVVRGSICSAIPTFNPEHYKAIAPTRRARSAKPSAESLIDAAIDVQESTEAVDRRGHEPGRDQLHGVAPPGWPPRIANAIADAYIEWNIESRFKQIGQSSQFLAAQIETGQVRDRGQGEGPPGVRTPEGHRLRGLEREPDSAAARLGQPGPRQRDHGPRGQGIPLRGGSRPDAGGARGPRHRGGHRDHAKRPAAPGARLRREAQRLQARVARDAAAQVPDRRGPGRTSRRRSPRRPRRPSAARAATTRRRSAASRA